MNDSFDQHAAHKPSPSTGSRHAAQSCGSAIPTANARPARTDFASEASLLVRACSVKSSVVTSTCMTGRYRSGATMVRGRARMRECRMASAPVIFDRALLRARRRRAAALGASTFLLDRAAEELADRLATVRRDFAWAVDLATPSDTVRRVLAGNRKVG